MFCLGVLLAGIATIGKSATLLATADLTGNGVFSESCEVDTSNNVVYVQYRSNVSTSLGTITSDTTMLAAGTYDYMPGLIDAAVDGTGMFLMGTTLYISTISGYFESYSTTDGSQIASVFIQAGLNGLCNDPDNAGILYTTAVGINFNTFQPDMSEAVIKIDTNTMPYNITYIYDASTDIGNNGYDMHPNGCVVKDGVIYFVETNLDLSGKLVSYNMNTDTWVVDTNSIGTADGIIYANNRFYVSKWGSFDPTQMAGTIESYEVTDGITSNSAVDIDGLVSPADICLDSVNNVIFAPSLQGGVVYAIDISETGSSNAYKVSIYFVAAILLVAQLLQ